jgi:serine/threonine-protein kinase
MADDLDRWMADEPVTAWREPWTLRLLRWLTRHHTGVTGAAAAVLAGVMGLSAVLAVQASANARLSQSLKRETSANNELKRSKAAVQARYDLAVEAVKSFHTGVSEDFLLKEERFKQHRDRLLETASDFYGKLGALLGKEMDSSSRRALAQSNFELAELTRKIGHPEAALAEHQAVLEARELLAAEPGADTGRKADIGRSLTAVAYLLRSTGKADEALATYRRSETLLAGLTGSEAARAALAACRTRMANLLMDVGQSAEALAVCKLARADQEALAAVPGASNDTRRHLSATTNKFGILVWDMGKPAEAEPQFRAALEIQRKLVDENPAVTEFRESPATSQLRLGNVLWETGNLAVAEAEHRTALALYQKLADENPAVTLFRRDVANSREWLGGMLLPAAGCCPRQARWERRRPSVARG